MFVFCVGWCVVDEVFDFVELVYLDDVVCVFVMVVGFMLEI